MAGQIVYSMLRAQCPIDTGNLSQHGIWPNDDGSEIYIGGERAPYAVYTNEPWVSEKWHGHKNPNEGWIDKVLTDALPIIKAALSGDITEDEYNEIISNNNSDYQARLDKIAAENLKKAAKI